jgi:hypothetical protein
MFYTFWKNRNYFFTFIRVIGVIYDFQFLEQYIETFCKNVPYLTLVEGVRYR